MIGEKRDGGSVKKPKGSQSIRQVYVLGQESFTGEGLPRLASEKASESSDALERVN